MDNRNVVLTGFMGAGKTTVGRILAERLDREFVDMDQVIEAREGEPISEIFSRQGEPYFRKRERELCAELSPRTHLVIATGGGALIDPDNRALFSNATVVCLDVSREEIKRRLNGANDRPLLGVGFRGAKGELRSNRREQISSLLAARQAAYAAISLHVDTTGRTVEEVARAVEELFAAAAVGASRRLAPTDPPLHVRTPSGSYPIRLGAGMLNRIGEYLPRTEFATRCAVVTNPTVGKLYASRLLDSLRSGGFDPIVVEIPDGEQYKNLDTLRSLYDKFIAAHLERHSLAVGLGGGVIGDMAGLAAATYMRGVPFVQVPTTLLAMVDASIGGKVAVDHPAGKNLIGAFKFPYAVIADPDMLATLPAEELRSGLAEVIKHAIIGDAELFDRIALREVNADIIARAMRVKIAHVERDPYEENVRAHLNLGHTFGHALETLSAYRLRHGYAVAIGMAIAARLAFRTGRCDVTTRDRIVALLQAKLLPTQAPAEFGADQIMEAMGADKKIREGKLRLILPRAIGEVELVDDVAERDLLAAIEES